MNKERNKKTEEEINGTPSSKVNPFERKDAAIREVINSVVASFKNDLDNYYAERVARVEKEAE